MTALPRPVEILLEAADLIEVDGWTQGDYHRFTRDGGCAHCADGSLYVAAGIHRLLDPADTPTGLTYTHKAYVATGAVDDDAFWAYSAAYDAAGQVADRRVGRSLGIIGYNDQPDTTAADVVSALREAASDLFEQAG